MNIHTGIKFMAVSAAVTVGASAGFASAAFAAGFGSQAAGSNNEAAKPAAQIFADAKQATRGAKTVQITGSYDEGSTNLSVNLVVGKGEGSGTITMHSDTFHIVFHGKDVDLKASAATWKNLTGDSEVGSLVGNKWIDFGQNGAAKTYAQLVSVSFWENAVSVDGSLTNAGTTTYHGQAAIDLKADDGSDLYVAAQGPAYVLGVVHGDGAGSLNFSNYDTARVAPAPHGAKSLDSIGSVF